MIKLLCTILPCVALTACVGGPTHDYYNAAVVNGPKFKGPVTTELVDNIDDSKAKCLADGYKLIGTTSYVGKYPEAVEINKQARRVHANHVVYSAVRMPNEPGSWHFNMFGRVGSGGTDDGNNNVHIVFLGK